MGSWTNLVVFLYYCSGSVAPRNRDSTSASVSTLAGGPKQGFFRRGGSSTCSAAAVGLASAFRAGAFFLAGIGAGSSSAKGRGDVSDAGTAAARTPSGVKCHSPASTTLYARGRGERFAVGLQLCKETHGEVLPFLGEREPIIAGDRGLPRAGPLDRRLRTRNYARDLAMESMRLP